VLSEDFPGTSAPTQSIIPASYLDQNYYLYDSLSTSSSDDEEIIDESNPQPTIPEVNRIFEALEPTRRRSDELAQLVLSCFCCCLRSWFNFWCIFLIVPIIVVAIIRLCDYVTKY
jgi:hypothetical protein